MKKASKKNVGPVTECQVCKGKRLKLYLPLGHHPVPQEYLTKKGLLEMEATYPLNLVYCEGCGLVQVDYIVPPELVFPPHYPYRTGLTNMLVRNFQNLADTLEKEGYVKKDGLAVDIGSNDGTLLKPFKAKGMRVVGIEPTGAADVANKNRIPTLKSFLNKETVAKIVKKHGSADIVTATNVFAHINDVDSLLRNIKNLLSKDGIFVSESQYLMDIMKKLEFDTVYHEHLRFYALGPLKRLLEKGGFSIVDAEHITAAGGSIRVYAKKGKCQMSARAKALMAAEEKAGLYDFSTYQKFAERIMKAKQELLSLLLDLKKNGATIAGLTSSCRSNTLLRYTNITDDILEYTGERRGSPKIGMYTPGTHIPVVDEGRIIKEQPEYLLILSWHIGEELAKIMRKIGYKGKFIIPLPTPRVID
ncbi:MAG: class I SAM-dependent methyltransferase [Candidatus Liptonbacteria bacterium]|nr:class I SAM-dependent methyltransferase [Candidatus Liptonbacteria bacterium]